MADFRGVRTAAWAVARVIARAGETIFAIIIIAFLLICAFAGAAMVAVPFPLFLHFLAKYGVTGTAAAVIGRLAGAAVIGLCAWGIVVKWRETADYWRETRDWR
jgi:hypothetical protein